jgi:hypothetical protein
MQALDILVVTAAVTVADIMAAGIMVVTTVVIMANITGITVTTVDMADITIPLRALRINLRYRL